VYSGSDRKCATPSMTATDATVTGLKMWDTNCTWTTNLQSYFMIYILRQ
jgi:hypothetical protein